MGKNQWHIVVFKAYMIAAFSFVLLAFALKGCVTINKYYPTKRDTVVVCKERPYMWYGTTPYLHIDTLPQNYINLLGSGRLVIDTNDWRVTKLKDTLIIK